MRKETISEIIGSMDEKYVEEAAGYTDLGENKAAKRTYKPLFRLVACIVLMVAFFSIRAAFLAEAKEYQMAKEFFEENGLSMEGLSRAEVKEVYRDIATQRFTYDKTAEVISRRVSGYEILQAEPSPDELARIWNGSIWKKPMAQTGLAYAIDYREKMDESLRFEILDKSIVECYQDGELLWTAEFPGIFVEGYAHTSIGTAVWGYNASYSSAQSVHGYIARVVENGKVLWIQDLRHDFGLENVAAVIDNGDGTWAVISRGDLKVLCLSQYDKTGKELSCVKTEVGNLGIRNAARLGDGYIVQAGNTMSGDTALLFKMDREGNITDSFTYEGEDCDYYLKDMIEYGGRVYLSSYAVPKQKDEGGRHEIADILNYVFDGNRWDISSEELTPIVRDNYTAVLLLCDPEGGVPETFYSVKGSLGGELSVSEEGLLCWDTESIISTFFSPATSSFTIGGTCKVFRYSFDNAGSLMKQEDTGETVPYRK